MTRKRRTVTGGPNETGAVPDVQAGTASPGSGPAPAGAPGTGAPPFPDAPGTSARTGAPGADLPWGAGFRGPQPPARLAPLSPRQWPPEMRAALAALVPPAPRHPRPGRREDRPKALNALGVLARYPELTHAFHTFNGHVLFGTSLTVRQRELLVLRVARLRGCVYEWAQHAVLARDAGVTDEEIDRVAEGPDAPGWSEGERHLVGAVDELLADARVSDPTWSELGRFLDERQLLDLVFTVGAYDALAMAFLSCGVQLDDDLAATLDPGRRQE